MAENDAPERIWIPVGKLRVGFWGSVLKDGVEYVRADLAAPDANGVSWSALLNVLERLRSKNRNPNNEWYHGWNAAIQCLINDVNARAVQPAQIDPVNTYPTVVESVRLLEAAGFGAVGKPNTLLDMVKEAIAAVQPAASTPTEKYDAETDAMFDDFLRTDPSVQYVLKQEAKKRAAASAEAQGEKQLFGELWLDTQGEAHFICHTKDDDFAKTKDAFQKFIALLQRQIDNERECPFYRPTTPPDFTEQQDKEVTGFEPIPLLERAMRTSMRIECDCDRSDYDACHGNCAGSLIWNDIHRARKLLTREPNGNFTEQARQLVDELKLIPNVEIPDASQGLVEKVAADLVASFAAEASTQGQVAFPFACGNGHEEIRFKGQDALNGEGICPLCFLRDQVLLEVAQPRANYEMFNLDFSARALHEYPFEG